MIAPRLSRGLCLLVGLGLLAGACSPKRPATTIPTPNPSVEAVGPTLAAPAPPPASPPANPTTSARQHCQGPRGGLTLSTPTCLGRASYVCSYVPPPEILPIRLLGVTVPGQSWSGAQCAGSLQPRVQGPETATAAGQPWSVWRA